MKKFVKQLQKPRCNQDMTNTYTDTYKGNRLFTIIGRTGNRFNYPDKQSYKDVVLCEAWKNDPQTFFDWFEKNMYEISDTIIEIDKDIRTFEQGICKEYSPETCLPVPKRINILFERFSCHRIEKDTGTEGYKTTIFGHKVTGQTYDEVLDIMCNLYNDRLKFLISQYEKDMPQEVTEILKSKDFRKCKWMKTEQ